MSLRQSIQDQVRRVFAGEPGAPPESLDGDAGLFGPDSASWLVHGDLTSMMVGGVASLLLQMLHPRALAGVWDHSNFRQDRLGRLRRTARFIARTTYGTTDEAQHAIAQVRDIHARVKGLDAEGRPYSADDPDLLTWIHVAEVTSFLRAYLRYKDPTFSAADQDRYFAETALVAERLGAMDVPKSCDAAEGYLQKVRPLLRYDLRTAEVASALMAEPQGGPTKAVLASRLLFRAAWALLPDWAARMHGVRVPLAERGAISVSVHGMAGVLRWAMQDSAEIRARRRVARSTG
jgi:uncharacterized protein (DUF2236 family)